MTINAVADAGHAEVVESILAQRHDFYHDIVERNPSQVVFLNGWLNRLLRVRTKAVLT